MEGLLAPVETTSLDFVVSAPAPARDDAMAQFDLKPASIAAY